MADAKHILAVDLGTGGPKVALVSTDGEIAGYEIETTPIHLLPNGGAEQDPEDWWRAITTAARRLLARNLVPADSIVGLGLTTQWMGTVAIDRDGHHLSNAIIWMDSRGARYARRLTKGAISLGGYGALKLREWIKYTAGVPSRTGKDSLGHILFLKNERRDIYRAAHQFLEPMDYLNMRLTGIAAASFDTITGHWVTDNRDLACVTYVDKLIEMSGIDRAKLPDLRPTGSVLGPILPEIARDLGLRDDVQVVMGMPDNESAAIGSGAVRDLEAHLYIGTSSWLSCHVPYKKTDVINSIATFPSGIPGKYLVATEQDVAGASLTMLRDNLFFARDELGNGPAPADVFETFNKMAERVPPGSGGLIFTPWLIGERTPVENSMIRGGFFNQSLSTTRAQFIRAVFEGVAYNTRWMHQTVERFVKHRFDAINFIGGGANSPLWSQIHADVLGRTIRQAEQPRLANARGIAFATSVALGFLKWEDIPARVRFAGTFEPNPENRKLYDEMFEEFLNIYKNNKKAFARLNRRRKATAEVTG
jgi:xylulokinase